MSNFIGKKPLAIIIAAPPKAINITVTKKPKVVRKALLSSWKKMLPKETLLIKM
jgi:hypothetical protein